MDLDTVADELYGLRPEQFTAARGERAVAALAAGDRTLAGQISRLRRPSLAAWASNLLVRRQPDQVQPLVELGEALRQAHRDLDGEQLRELVHQQRLLIGALSRQAAQLAAEAGHPIGADARREVQDTLQAVLGDPDAARQWASGRLTKALTPAVGFPATTAKAPPPPAGPAARPAKAPPSRRREESAASAAEQRRRRQLDEAHRSADEADRDLRAREAEAEEATRQAQDAKERRDTLEERVSALAQELERVEEELGQARTDERAAREKVRDGDRRVREARRRARTAATRLERLTAHDQGA
ncbi:hypothetical protein [Streptomyces sp. HUAS ZL42]|uniref:hypothetical protein n=1 Tax=Streptomyces sp. HUAS ZL42 TaxID=3231715 RepID=UPI00345ED96B